MHVCVGRYLALSVGIPSAHETVRLSDVSNAVERRLLAVRLQQHVPLVMVQVSFTLTRGRSCS